MGKKSQFKWRDSARFSVPADVAGRELQRISKQHGTLTSELVVDAARPEDAQLHPVFEWDDQVAGENYRKHQARTLIRSIVVVNEKTQEMAPVYVHVPKESGSEAGYHPVEVVAQRPDMYAAALTSLFRHLENAKTAVAELQKAAQQSDLEPDRMAQIGLAVQALSTASAAIQALH